MNHLNDDNQLKEKISVQLKQVLDPELQRDIVSLGMLKELEVREGEVRVHLEISAAAASVRQSVQSQIQEKLRSVPGIRSVKIEITSPAKGASAFALKQPVAGMGHVIAVASGKGGVGKTTVAVNLAVALAKLGHKVGLMDGDIYGPNVPLMLGISEDARPQVNAEEKMEPIEAYGIRTISMGVLVPADQPMVWRGPMLHSAVVQFVQKVAWGELDYLLVDLPPGTGDVQLSLVQTVSLSGAVIVTTPQEVALMDVRKGIVMFHKTQVPILGIIENMTGDVFGSGGGKKAALQFRVPFLGEIPLDQTVREGGDSGRPIVAALPESRASKAFMAAAVAVQNSDRISQKISS